MFNKSILSVLVLVAGFSSAQANAAFVPTDWKFVGDKKSTLDTETGLEWLDLDVTNNLSMSDVAARLTSDYAGWRFPSASEMNDMFSRFFSTIDHSYEGFVAGAFDDWLLWSSLFGFHEVTESGVKRSAGMFYNENGVETLIGAALLNGGPDIYVRPGAPDNPVFYDSSFDKFWGVYLVSDGGVTLSSINNPSLNIKNPNYPVEQTQNTPSDIPVHAGFGVLGLLLIAFGLRRRSLV